MGDNSSDAVVDSLQTDPDSKYSKFGSVLILFFFCIHLIFILSTLSSSSNSDLTSLSSPSIETVEQKSHVYDICAILDASQQESIDESVSKLIAISCEAIYGIHSKRVLIENKIQEGTLWISSDNGTILSAEAGELTTDSPYMLVDLGNLVVMPGLIDIHVHMNEPGRKDWEGFETGTRAAAAGGTTTVFDMPLNGVPSTVSIKSLLEKLRAMEESELWVDVGLIGGIVEESQLDTDELDILVNIGGVVALKSFMIDSGSSDFTNVSPETLRVAMRKVSALQFDSTSGDLPYMLHAELSPHSGWTQNLEMLRKYGSESDYPAYEASRSESLEVEAIRLALELSAETQCRIHICHVASPYAAEILHAAQLFNAPITAESCPHYLLFASDEIESDFATLFKCAPPIRPSKQRQLLWSHVEKNTLSIISSDHSPSIPSMKSTSDLTKAWGGISGLQHRLSATWTASKLYSSLNLEHLSRLLSQDVSKLAGLNQRKGQFRRGFDADLVIWSPEECADTSIESFQAKHKISPFLDMKLAGKVYSTIVRGNVVFSATATEMQCETGNANDCGSMTRSNLKPNGQLVIRKLMDSGNHTLKPHLLLTSPHSHRESLQQSLGISEDDA